MATFTDLAGQKYTSPDNKPAADQVQVSIQTSNGPISGKMIGGYAQPDKKSG